MHQLKESFSQNFTGQPLNFTTTENCCITSAKNLTKQYSGQWSVFDSSHSFYCFGGNLLLYREHFLWSLSLPTDDRVIKNDRIFFNLHQWNKAWSHTDHRCRAFCTCCFTPLSRQCSLRWKSCSLHKKSLLCLNAPLGTLKFHFVWNLTNTAN